MRPGIAPTMLMVGLCLAFAGAARTTGLPVHDSGSDTNIIVTPTATQSGHDAPPAARTIKILRAAANGSLRRELDVATGASPAPRRVATPGGSSVDLTSATDEIFWDGFELCGDGVIEVPEECDRQDLGGASCLSQGYSGGVLACDKTCHFDTSQCAGLCPTSCIIDADCGVCGPCIPVTPGVGICAL